MNPNATTWRFPRAFWSANASELFERSAFYGTFIVLRKFLLDVVGLGDVSAGYVGAIFSASIYLFPFFTGAAADRLGFRRALLLALCLLTAGYALLGASHALAPVLLALLLIVLGGAFVKPVISGTASKSSNEASRARAFSIFYMMVNIGSFTGKSIAAPVRLGLGVSRVPYFSAGAAFLALLVVALLYRPPESEAGRPRGARETLAGMVAAMGNLRFTALILITAGFWAIQGQLYASMPDYVMRMAGEGYKPEWYANVNPLVVVLGVVAVTQLVRRWAPETSIAVAMTLIPLSSLTMSAAPLFTGPARILGAAVHPITLLMVVGIAIQGLAECFLSPKYLEFASRQAPPGREGLYLGYAHLNTFFAWLFGFIFGGYMLRMFCPNPRELPAAIQQAHERALAGLGPMPEAWLHAHYLWYAFALVGAVSCAAMLAFVAVTRRADARAAALARASPADPSAR
jgi:dipeptide/tripeptide permease